MLLKKDQWLCVFRYHTALCLIISMGRLFRFHAASHYGDEKRAFPTALFSLPFSVKTERTDGRTDKTAIIALLSLNRSRKEEDRGEEERANDKKSFKKF